VRGSIAAQDAALIASSRKFSARARTRARARAPCSGGEQRERADVRADVDDDLAAHVERTVLAAQHAVDDQAVPSSTRASATLVSCVILRLPWFDLDDDRAT
jgi:hypothetical protein